MTEDALRLGSLCSGIAGLERSLDLAGISTVTEFVSDIDRGASEWLASTMPDVPNLGDFTELDRLPDVDILTAGFPCQPFSSAGLRKGFNDERWLFDDICRLVSSMGTRPILFLENVSGLRTANDGGAMGRVVYGLAGIGYDLTWGTLPASAVGAPHRRLRWFGLAVPADADIASGQTRQHEGSRSERPRQQPVGHPAHHFGRYVDAVRRWELILGRAAPLPVDDEGRLSPRFVEWMMGYDDGYVTDILTARTRSLHVLGNAVVPQAGAEAFRQLSSRVWPTSTD